MQPVAFVGEHLAHHVDQRPLPGDQPPLLAIGGEEHVAWPQLERVPDSERFLAGAAHVERGLALALGTLHPVVVGAGQHHRSQPGAELVGTDVWCPRSGRTGVVVEYPDQRVGEVADFGRIDIVVRATDRSCRGDIEVGKVRVLTRPSRGLRHYETQPLMHRHHLLFALLVQLLPPPADEFSRRPDDG